MTLVIQFGVRIEAARIGTAITDLRWVVESDANRVIPYTYVTDRTHVNYHYSLEGLRLRLTV